MKDYIQVFTTTAKKEDAKKIAKALLEKRLAACAQVMGPIGSSFWWKGKIDKAQEWMCIIKSKKSLYKKIEKCIKQNHPYQVPEIVGIPITAGNKDYLKWLDEELMRL